MPKHFFRFVSLLFLLPALVLAQETPNTIQLPKPDTSGGKPLMQVLKARKTSRSFSSEKLKMQDLSNLLWAAFGINRPDGHRTAPSAMNWQEIDLYAATDDGLYLYDAKNHVLKQILKDDIRAKTGTQGFVKDAPLNLIYVADAARMSKASDEDKIRYPAADAGFIAENVYLYCASAGLATVVRASIDRPALAKAMNLRPEQTIVLAQTVGYPQ
jgi:SagB-type dehydrogenase family enzyme